QALASIQGLSELTVRSELLAVAKSYPNFTMEQRVATLRALHAERYPPWRSLSSEEMARRLFQIVADFAHPTSGNQPPSAPFLVNFTAITSPANNAVLMQRQSDCSLTLVSGPFSYSLTSQASLTFDVSSATPNYDQVLHNAAGLTTKTGQFTSGCGD